MNGSERPRGPSALANTIRDAVRGRIRFAGLAYLAGASMMLTLVAGAFISTQGSVDQQAAPLADVQLAVSPSPTRGEADSTDHLALIEDAESGSSASEAPPQPTPAPIPQEPAGAPPARFVRPAAAVQVPPPADSVKAQLAPTPTVAITDAGFVPDQVTVKAGEAIQWTNEGSKVHTATALNGSYRFDTGGLAAHQSAKVAFAAPGTFTYSSATDCLNGNHDPGFTCGKYFVVTVTG